MRQVSESQLTEHAAAYIHIWFLRECYVTILYII